MLIRERSCKSKRFRVCLWQMLYSRQIKTKYRRKKESDGAILRRRVVRGISVLNAHGYEKISYCR